MIERLFQVPEFDRATNYSNENYPPYNDQAEFFRYALLEGAEIAKKPRLVAGPFYKDCTAIMRATDEMLKSINPGFTPEHLAPDSYRSPRVRQEVKDLDAGTALYDAGLDRLRLTDALATRTLDAMKGQEITPGTLGTPDYCRQHDGWGHIDSERACSLACFRMVFGAIAGWIPSEAAIGNELVKQYGTAVVDDAVLNNMYQTEIFREICDKEVISFDLIGADFATIADLAAKIKQRQKDAEVYCIVNRASSGASRNIWHTCVLLDVTSAGVLCHDPSGHYGGASKLRGRKEFLRDWAAAYNRAQLIVAV